MKIIFEYRGSVPMQYKTRYSAGADLINQNYIEFLPGETKVISTGLYIKDFDYDHLGDFLPLIDVRPCSSISKRGLLTHLGTVDVDYNSHEIGVIMTNLSNTEQWFNYGAKVGQIVCLQCFRSESFEILNLPRTGGFGSTGF